MISEEIHWRISEIIAEEIFKWAVLKKSCGIFRRVVGEVSEVIAGKIDIENFGNISNWFLNFCFSGGIAGEISDQIPEMITITERFHGGIHGKVHWMFSWVTLREIFGGTSRGISAGNPAATHAKFS